MTEIIDAREKVVVVTRIPGEKWLEVETHFAGREVTFVQAKWEGGSLEIEAERLHRIQSIVLGARNAAQDGRGMCPLHGYIDSYSWADCPKCDAAKKALITQRAEKALPAADPEF